jgi:hypothetical protein
MGSQSELSDQTLAGSPRDARWWPKFLGSLVLINFLGSIEGRKILLFQV